MLRQDLKIVWRELGEYKLQSLSSGIHLVVVVAVLITGIVFLAVALQVNRAVGSDPAKALKEGE